VVIKKEVLEKRRRILSEEYLFIILAINNLISTLRDQGQLDKAVAIFKEVLEKIRQIFGEEHPFTILAINNLTSMFRD